MEDICTVRWPSKESASTLAFVKFCAEGLKLAISLSVPTHITPLASQNMYLTVSEVRQLFADDHLVNSPEVSL